MNEFERHVQGVVAEFLETALVVDDESLKTFGVRDQPTTPEPTPVRSRADLGLEEPSVSDLETAGELHPLNTKALLDAFADLGLVCSVLAPIAGDEIQTRVLKSAARSDLLIFDWELHRDGGQTARALIKAVLRQDSGGNRRRLRVIAIYTGQPRLTRIMEQVRRELELPSSAKEDEGAALAHDNVRIVAFSKPLSGRRTGEQPDREISEADLPARLAEEFARLTHGLVPAVALAALASIRNDTHRILQAMRSDMDVGYLGHRVASSFPEDAEGHLVDIVSSEIASVLDDGDVGCFADIHAIRRWLAQARGGAHPLACGSAFTPPKSITEDQVDKMLTVGLGIDEDLDVHVVEGLGKGALKKIRRDAAQLFTNEVAAANHSADIFGTRMALRTLYARPRRVLRLGTIVARRGKYFICVQPRCDSVRLTPGEPRSFPFLPLRVTDEGDARHEFVVQNPESNDLVRLRLHTKPFALTMWSFECGATRSVEAKKVRGRYGFYNTRNHRFVWVADLKPEFAQRVAVDLAAEMARVGLSESELIRLSGS